MAKSGKNRGWKLCSASCLAMGFAIAYFGDCANAQIKPDGTLGAESSVVTPTNINGITTDRIDGGAVRGANLFHSFREFNIDEGRGAYFTNPIGIENILSRVTGNDPSDILGTLGVLGNANLFLINPNGIIFGQNASLDVGGSFVATTANAIQFGAQGFFSASDPKAAPLLTVNPSAFFFNQITPASIENKSKADAGSDPAGASGYFGLRVPDGQSLLLVGGDIKADGGGIVALGGRVDLGAVAGIGTVGLEQDGKNLSLSISDNIARADVSLTNEAGFIVAAGGGGSIAITAQNINILKGSSLYAGMLSNLGSVGAQAGDIKLNAAETIVIAGLGRSLVENDINPNATGNGGNINIQAGAVFLRDGAVLSADTFGEGNAGDINITARDTVSIEGIGDTRFNTLVLSRVEQGAVGNAGDIKITTGSLLINNNAQISSITESRGNSGNVVIQAQDFVSLSNANIFTEVSDGEVTGSEGGIGSGGDIKITTRDLSLTNGSQLRADTENRGNAGKITIVATDTVTIAGRGPGTGPFRNQIVPSGISSTVEERAIGEGGDISIKTSSLTMNDGSLLDTRTIGQGDAGDIFIEADNFVSIASSDALIFSEVSRDGRFEGTEGNGGDINITTGSLAVTEGAQLLADTEARGDAGDINIVARDTVSFDGEDGNGQSSSAFTRVEFDGIGDGGNISITTGSLSVTNTAQLRAQTEGRGDAGNINIVARDTVSFDGRDSDGLPSGAFSSVNAGAIGDGGKIEIKTKSFSVTNGAVLNTSTSSTGKAGNIIVNATERVTLDGSGSSLLATTQNSPIAREAGNNDDAGQSIDTATDILGPTGSGGPLPLSNWSNGGRDRGAYTISLTDISATPATVPGGDGGNINIKTGSLSVTNGAGVVASSSGSGAAGNIEIAADSIRLNNQAFLSSDTTAGQGNLFLRSEDLVLNRGSNITTDATGTATGGNITIDTGVIAASENSDITANAEEAGGGRVIINAQGIFGTEFREDQTSQSDITASSNLGSQFSGTVEINTPDVDPSQGLVELPAELVDASNQIAPSCAAVGENEFIITGRGGLPPNPIEPLSGEAVLTNLATLDPEVENRSGAEETATKPARERAPTRIVEAQGWVINNKGEVVLTANAPNATPHNPWMPSANCHAPKTSS